MIEEESQRLEQDIRVEMFELDTTERGGDLLLFSPTSIGGQPVTFAGKVYQPAPIKTEGFSWDGSGALPRPTLTVGVKDLAFLSFVLGADDLVGCPIKRIVTYRRFLDDGAQPNPTAHFPIDEYVVERKQSQARNTLNFELSAKMDQEGRMIPARQVLRDACTHSFRRWVNGEWDYSKATCPYSAPQMYNAQGQQITDPTKARCGKKLSDCQLHFGADAELPFYGFPGVGRI